MNEKLRDAAQAAVDLLKDDDRDTYIAIRVLEAALMEPKPWVGLTGDEIEDLPKGGTLWEIIRAAEALLKEKNGG